MKKFIIAFLVIILIGATAFGIIYYRKLHTGSGNISGGIPGLETGEKTSQEYLELIKQYTKQIDGLKTELANNQEKYSQTIANYQAEISSLQQEIETMGEENAELIKEKNERIQTLRAYIKTIEDEHSEKDADYEKRISELNSLLNNYESNVLQRINLPSDFIFTRLGFKIIENNDFIFYSESHSCKLYYYHFDTQTLETIPVKGTSFDSFYKLNNVLYFRTGAMLYSYNFNRKEISIITAAPCILTYTADTNNLYAFDYSGGYGVFNFSTLKFDNYLKSSYSYSVVVMKLDNYILHQNSYNNKVCCFDTETQTDKVILDGSSAINSFIKTNDGYFMCIGKGFYKFDISTMSVELIKEFNYTYNSCYLLGNNIVVFGYTNAYIYENSTLKEVASYSGCDVKPTFYKLSDDIYYVVGSSSSFSGLWKLDFANNTLTQLSSSFYSHLNDVDTESYWLIGMNNGIYVVDKSSGTVDSLSVYNSYSALKIINCDNFDIFYCYYLSGNYSNSYVYFYDKVNDMYGKMYKGNTFSIMDCKYMNGILYIMGDNNLYTYNLDASLDNYVNNLSIDGSLSNLKVGVFYSKVGTLDGSNLYVKYILQEDGTFVKELVII